MHAKAFARDLLIGRHDTFRLHVQTDGDTLVVDGLDDTADDLADLFLEVIGLHLALSLADALLDHLARGLSSHASKVFGRAVNHNHISQVGFRINLAGLLQSHLGAVILNFFHHFLLGEDVHLTRFRVNFCLHMLGIRRNNGTAISRDHGRFDG